MIVKKVSLFISFVSSQLTLTQVEKDVLLNVHNDLRQQLADGQVDRMPGATDMNMLVFN